MTYANARLVFIKYLANAGLTHRGYTLHCLRHTCASELLNAGMRLECLQQLLGHSTIEMTRRYARLTDKTREAEYFQAMSRIERGEIDSCYQLDPELPEVFEKKELLETHGEELPEHP
jgi:integrase